MKDRTMLGVGTPEKVLLFRKPQTDKTAGACLLYTSDAADERSSVDLGGRRIIKKKKRRETLCVKYSHKQTHTKHTRDQQTKKIRIREDTS